MAPTTDTSREAGARLRFLIPGMLFLSAFALYAATAAPGTLFGDPSEYQFIPAILGIAHPPGYAFYTLLAKLWQLAVPVGTVAFRTNLLASAVGGWVVTAVYLLVSDMQSAWIDWHPDVGGEGSQTISVDAMVPCLSAVFAALVLAAAPDLWQHAIHANAHIVSAGLAVTHLWLLARWWRTGRDGWLGAFGVTMGLAVTHHPITLMGVPAYGLFMLSVRGRELFRWSTLVILASTVLVGLSPLLYYPLRSPAAPFGPTDMNTWDGFTRHITARGLRVNLFHFGLADQLDRTLVFWSLLRLQYPLPVILLIPVGLVLLVRRVPRLALLMGGFVVGHLAFTLNTVQDVMAYLLPPFAALAGLAGVGAWGLLIGVSGVVGASRSPSDASQQDAVPLWLHLVLVAALLLWPVGQGVQNLSRGISLRDFEAAERWVRAVRGRFEGRREGAVLLASWEYLTPLWVHAYTEDWGVTEDDLDLTYVSTATPWAEAVWSHIEAGEIYLPDFRPPVRQAGFRMIPEGTFYRVEAPPVTEAEPAHPVDVRVEDRIGILGYDLPEKIVRAGEPLALTLYQRVDEPLGGIWMPYAQLGTVEARWTTDSRLLTTHWQAGEIVVERYEVPVPFDMEPGDYPLRLGYADLSGGRPSLPLSTGEMTHEIATVSVRAPETRPAAGVLDSVLANLDNQIGLMAARVRSGLRMRRAFWEEPIVVRSGASLHLTLEWRALASPRESATVFVHLIDAAERPVVGWDYTPLGGSAPTYLWFPKWLPGQTFLDPYRLSIPRDVPPGDYRLEVGMYGMTSQRRLPVVDSSGDLAGDRVILGTVRVE